eukprot:jgi/Ulvmu1/2738/UM014_0195.1
MDVEAAQSVRCSINIADQRRLVYAKLNLQHQTPLEDLLNQLRAILAEELVPMIEPFDVRCCMDLGPASLWLTAGPDRSSAELHLLKCLYGIDTKHILLRSNSDVSTITSWPAVDMFTRAYRVCHLKLDNGCAPGLLRDQMQLEGLYGLQQLLHVDHGRFISLAAVETAVEEGKHSNQTYTPRPLCSVIVAILIQSQRKSDSIKLALNACQLAWGMSVHAVTRALLLDHNAVVAIWTRLVPLPHAAISKLCDDDKHCQMVGNQSDVTDIHTPGAMCDLETGKHGKDNSILIERKLVECCIGALNVFVVDRRAREQLLAAPRKDETFMALLFELACADPLTNCWTDVKSGKSTATEPSAPVPFPDPSPCHIQGSACTHRLHHDGRDHHQTSEPQAHQSSSINDTITAQHATAADSTVNPTTNWPDEWQDCNRDKDNSIPDFQHTSIQGSPAPSPFQLAELSTSRLAAGIITTLLCRDAEARHMCLERQGSLGVVKLLNSPSACIQVHGLVALAAFAADAPQLKMLDMAFGSVSLIALVCSMIRDWTGKQLGGTSVIRELHSTSSVAFGLELLECALNVAVQAKLEGTGHDGVFAALTELMHCMYWCLSCGPAANYALTMSVKCVAVILTRQDHAEAVLFDMRVLALPEYARFKDGPVSILEYVISGLLRAMGRAPIIPSGPGNDQTYIEQLGKVASAQALCPPELGTGNHCQLLAAMALSQLAAMPDKHDLPSIAKTRNRGPFRELLHNVGLLQHLVWLHMLKWEDRMRADVSAVVAYGTMILCSPGQQLPLPMLQAIIACLKAQVDDINCQPQVLQQFCFAIWTLCQHSANTYVLLAHAEGIDAGVRVVKRLFVHLDGLGTDVPQISGGLEGTARAIEAAVLLLWRLLEQLTSTQRGASASRGSYFISSPTTWWEFPVNTQCPSLILREPVISAVQVLLCISRITLDYRCARLHRGYFEACRQLALQALWSLQACDSGLHNHIISELNVCTHAAKIATDEGESEVMRCLGVTMMSLADTPNHIQGLGGPSQYFEILQQLLDICFTNSNHYGLGCQPHLLDVVCRAIAQLSFSQEGQVAIVQANGARKLFGVLRREVHVHLHPHCSKQMHG